MTTPPQEYVKLWEDGAGRLYVHRPDEPWFHGGLEYAASFFADDASDLERSLVGAKADWDGPTWPHHPAELEREERIVAIWKPRRDHRSRSLSHRAGPGGGMGLP